VKVVDEQEIQVKNNSFVDVNCCFYRNNSTEVVTTTFNFLPRNPSSHVDLFYPETNSKYG